MRLILFFALLVPLNIGGDRNAGLNAAQLITLWTAKTGSNFATNGWGYFNEAMNNEYLLSTERMIARPEIPQVHDITRFIFLAKVCQAATSVPIDAYITKASDSTPIPLSTSHYDVAYTFAEQGGISLVFGHHDPTNEDYKKYNGYVNPVCGELIVHTSGDINSSLSGNR